MRMYADFNLHTESTLVEVQNELEQKFTYFMGVRCLNESALRMVIEMT
jgi:hypothetical protein